MQSEHHSRHHDHSRLAITGANYFSVLYIESQVRSGVVCGISGRRKSENELIPHARAITLPLWPKRAWSACRSVIAARSSRLGRLTRLVTGTPRPCAKLGLSQIASKAMHGTFHVLPAAAPSINQHAQAFARIAKWRTIPCVDQSSAGLHAQDILPVPTLEVRKACARTREAKPGETQPGFKPIADFPGAARNKGGRVPAYPPNSLAGKIRYPSMLSRRLCQTLLPFRHKTVGFQFWRRPAQKPAAGFATRAQRAMRVRPCVCLARRWVWCGRAEKLPSESRTALCDGGLTDE
jgi:hypothetical protein